MEMMSPGRYWKGYDDRTNQPVNDNGGEWLLPFVYTWTCNGYSMAGEEEFSVSA
jgi:hypothetical protein